MQPIENNLLVKFYRMQMLKRIPSHLLSIMFNFAFANKTIEVYYPI